MRERADVLRDETGTRNDAPLGFVPEDDVQFHEAADSDLGVGALAAAGNFDSPLDWLRAHVHRHGRVRSAAELIEAATAASPSPEPLLEHLRANDAAACGG